MAAPPTLPPMESTDSFNPDFNNASSTANGANQTDDTMSSPIEPSAPAVQLQDYKQEAPDPQVQQKVQDVLHSDIGVNTLLNRLKASIASARVQTALSSWRHVR
jgi:hypothetical protein